MDLVAEMGVKNGLVLWPLRTALSGQPSSPGGVYEIGKIVGKEESLKRIRVGINKLKTEA